MEKIALLSPILQQIQTNRVKISCTNANQSNDFNYPIENDPQYMYTSIEKCKKHPSLNSWGEIKKMAYL